MTRSTVFLSITLLQFLKRILENHKAPTTIVICSTRSLFIYNLEIAIAQAQESYNSADKEVSQEYLTPTLEFLGKAQSVTLAFCPSLSSLRAYLSVYQASPRKSHDDTILDSSDNVDCFPTLALLNPISLFSDDPSKFSAQSVGRFFASAYEAAVRAEQDLIIAECYPSNRIGENEADASHLEHNTGPETNGDTSMVDSEDLGIAEEETGDDCLNRGSSEANNLLDPWTQLIPISDSTSKRIGSAQKRWLERSIKVQSVAERWCEFRNIAT